MCHNFLAPTGAPFLRSPVSGGIMELDESKKPVMREVAAFAYRMQ